jgi:hypothetical protein
MKVEEILDEMKELNEEQLKESGQPYIGIFYVVGDDILMHAEHPRLIFSTEGGQKNFNTTHSSFWYQVLSRLSPTAKQLIDRFDKEGMKISWKYLPRGRVLCSENNAEFVVYCDKHITDSNSLRVKVRNEMNLPYNTEFQTDGAHYKCYDCAPSEFMK